MAGRVDPSRDLRLGLHALENGAIDPDNSSRPLRTGRLTPAGASARLSRNVGLLAKSELARLEDEVDRQRATRRDDRDPSATVTYAGRPAGDRRVDTAVAPNDEASRDRGRPLRGDPAACAGRPGRGVSRVRSGTEPFGRPEGVADRPRPRPGRAGSIPARSRDHRQPRTPRDRAGL